MRYYELKEAVLKHYGESCTECNQVDPKQLRVIFADPSMRFWRKKHDLVSTEAFYRYLYKKDFPEKFRVSGKYQLITLCKFHYGIFVSAIPRSEDVKRKISETMRSRA